MLEVDKVCLLITTHNTLRNHYNTFCRVCLLRMMFLLSNAVRLEFATSMLKY